MQKSNLARLGPAAQLKFGRCRARRPYYNVAYNTQKLVRGHENRVSQKYFPQTLIIKSTFHLYQTIVGLWGFGVVSRNGLGVGADCRATLWLATY